MKLKNLAAIGMLGLVSFSASAEMAHYRLHTIVDAGNPNYGIVDNTPVAIDLSFDTDMPIEFTDSYGTAYKDHGRTTLINFDGIQNVVYDAHHASQTADYSVSKHYANNETHYNVDAFIHEVQMYDTAGYPTNGNINIHLQGAAPDTQGLPDLSQLTLNGDNIGDVNISGPGRSNFRVSRIEKCPENGCESFVSNEVTYELKGIATFNDTNHGIKAGDPITMEVSYNPDLLTKEYGDQYGATYSDHNGTMKLGFEAGTTTGNNESVPGNRNMINMWSHPSSNQVGVDLYFQNIKVTDAQGYVIYNSHGSIYFDGETSQPFNGDLFNLADMNVMQAGTWIPVSPNNFQFEIQSITEITNGGSCSAPTQVEDTAPISIEGSLQQFSPNDGHLQLDLRHTGGDHVYFNYSVDIALPSGFTWNIEPNNHNKIGLGPNTSGGLSVPVHLEPNWPAGQYEVNFKILSETGLFAKKSFTFQK